MLSLFVLRGIAPQRFAQLDERTPDVERLRPRLQPGLLQRLQPLRLGRRAHVRPTRNKWCDVGNVTAMVSAVDAMPLDRESSGKRCWTPCQVIVPSGVILAPPSVGNGGGIGMLPAM